MGSARKRKLEDDGELCTETAPASWVERFEEFRAHVVSDEELDNKFYKSFKSFLIDSRDDEVAVKGIYEKSDLRLLTSLLCRYTCTQKKADRYIFEILLCLERLYHVNLRPLMPLVFGEKSRGYYEQLINFGPSLHQAIKPDQVLEYFDGLTMWMTLIEMTRSELDSKRRRSMYDPGFVLRVLYHIVGPGSDLSCSKFVISNALSFTFAATSFQSAELRALAYVILGRYVKLLGDLSPEKFEPRSVYVMLINKFRNSIEEIGPRICHPVSHFFARVSKLMLHPEDPVYAPIMAFLLLKPTIDLTAVPEFYKLFYSSSTEFHQNERQWIIKLCAESMLDPFDYAVMAKNYVFEVCMTLFTSPVVDSISKALVLRLLVNCLQHRSVANELQRRCNLASWIASALQCPGVLRHEQMILSQAFITLRQHILSAPGSGAERSAHSLLRVDTEKVVEVVTARDDFVNRQMREALKQLTGCQADDIQINAL